MSISATEGYDPTQLASSVNYGAPAAASTGSSEDYDMFLQLLVAQLKYQDPMNPTSSTEFLSQNAQFTSLQKMGELNDALNSLLSVQSSFGSTNLIGKSVTYANADGTTGSGVATGVTFYSGGPVLTVDGKEVAVSAVITVGDAIPPVTPAAPANPASPAAPSTPADSSGSSSDATA